jgi:hypothetical protein
MPGPLRCCWHRSHCFTATDELSFVLLILVSVQIVFGGPSIDLWTRFRTEWCEELAIHSGH